MRGSRYGLVVGSMTHDAWKTGVNYRGSEGKAEHLHCLRWRLLEGDAGHDAARLSIGTTVASTPVCGLLR